MTHALKVKQIETIKNQIKAADHADIFVSESQSTNSLYVTVADVEYRVSDHTKRKAALGGNVDLTIDDSDIAELIDAIEDIDSDLASSITDALSRVSTDCISDKRIAEVAKKSADECIYENDDSDVVILSTDSKSMIAMLSDSCAFHISEIDVEFNDFDDAHNCIAAYLTKYANA